MSSNEIEELGNTRGIDPFVAAKACTDRTCGVTKIDQRDRKLLVFELLHREAIDGSLSSPVDEILQGSLLSGSVGNSEQHQRAKRRKGSYLHR